MKEIEKAIKLKNELDALRPLKAEDEMRIMQKFRLDWNYHSNNLEGNSLTYGETKALILFGVTAQGKPLKDHFEITGHNEAVKWIEELVKQKRPLTESFIRELHQLILRESYEVSAITPSGQPTTKRVQVGTYKTTPNHVRTITGEIFRFATPEETPAKMTDLIDWYRTQQKELNPILLAVQFHYKFICIHPFDDGNGRIARLLMNFILMQFGYPPVVIRTDDKENYLAALRQADAGMIGSFIDYTARNLHHSLELMIKGAKGESIEEPNDLDKELALLAQQLKALGQAGEISKSKEAILELYDNSIARVANNLMEKAEKFSQFYVENRFQIWKDGSGYAAEASTDEALEKLKANLNDSIAYITIEFQHRAFKQLGFGEFYHASAVKFTFNRASYKVENNIGISYEKRYGDYLNDDEIRTLVDTEMYAHKQLIASKIEAFKHKNNQ